MPISNEIQTTDTKEQLEVFNWCQELGLACEMEYSVSRYHLDIYLPEIKLGIELDGIGHLKKRDRKRDGFIKRRYGIDIWRYKNKEINSLTKSKFIQRLYERIEELDIED